AVLTLDGRHSVRGLQVCLERDGVGEHRRPKKHGRDKRQQRERGAQRMHFGPPNGSAELPVALTPGAAFYCVSLKGFLNATKTTGAGRPDTMVGFARCAQPTLRRR